MYNAAGAVVCGDPNLYRIKHVVTNKYLIANESRLEVANPSCEPCCFRVLGFRCRIQGVG